MSNRFRAGFTLVELMVTIAILAVLTMVAITSYKYYVRRARAQEGKNLLLEIKMKQEHYFSTYTSYVDTASSESTLYPGSTQHPKTANGTPDTTMYDWSTMDCTSPSTQTLGWCALGVRPQGPTYFRAVTLGWNKAKGSTPPSSSYGIVSNMNFTKRWYYAAVHGDMDEDGTMSTFIITSQAREIVEINAME